MSYIFNLLILVTGRSITTSNLRNAIRISRHWNNQLILFRQFSTTQLSMSSSSSYFKGKEDRYKGIIVDSVEEQCDIKDFSKKLEGSLNDWSEKEFRGIWFKVHLNQSDWVPILVQKGFKYHHAKEEYVMMYLWLPQTENANIPHFAHTMLGVGAVVINDKNELLVVQEKYTILNKPHYKLPGGYVEPGENIIDAAIREVREETNIKTEFQSVISLSHTHGDSYGCSNIYVVVSLKATSNDITKSDREILDCKWMDVDAFLNDSHVVYIFKYFVRKWLDYKKHDVKIDSYNGIFKQLNKPYSLYSITGAGMENDKDSLKDFKSKV